MPRPITSITLQQKPCPHHWHYQLPLGCTAFTHKYHHQLENLHNVKHQVTDQKVAFWGLRQKSLYRVLKRSIFFFIFLWRGIWRGPLTLQGKIRSSVTWSSRSLHARPNDLQLQLTTSHFSTKWQHKTLATAVAAMRCVQAIWGMEIYVSLSSFFFFSYWSPSNNSGASLQQGSVVKRRRRQHEVRPYETICLCILLWFFAY